MARIDTNRMEQALRRRVQQFLTAHSEVASPMAEALDIIRSRKWPSVVFGGVLRDLMVFGLRARPRDVDIVVDSPSVPEIASLFENWWVKPTRFGGLKLHMKKCLLDIWPLSETWAFRECGFPRRDFANLPKTTFLNVEAVAVQLTGLRENEINVFSAGFFEGVHAETVELNWAHNPFPELAVVRALITAAKLNFSIGPALAGYIVEQSARASIGQLMAAQLSHYGRIVLNQDEIHTYISSIEKHQKRFPQQKADLPYVQRLQLSLW